MCERPNAGTDTSHHYSTVQFMHTNEHSLATNQFFPILHDLQFDLPFSVVLQNGGVGLLDDRGLGFVQGGRRRLLGPHETQVPLHIPVGPGTAGRQQADSVVHCVGLCSCEKL